MLPGVKHLVERVVKFVLWSAGGWKLYLAGPDEIVQPIAKAYTKKGARAFDFAFFGDLYARPIEAVVVPLRKMPVTHEREVVVKNNTNGNRIGFDLGASDFKISALRKGKVVFSKEFPWDPRNQPDPEYHYEKLSAGLEEAALALGGQVDAIGGSTAGTLVGKRLGPASLIRAVLEASMGYDPIDRLPLITFRKWAVAWRKDQQGDSPPRIHASAAPNNLRQHAAS